MNKTVVVIIPTYNEKENIQPLVSSLHRVFSSLKTYRALILFVDDNSPDGTAKVIAQIARRYSYIKILHNKHKEGLGHAYKKGMRYALDRLHADILFEFDADLSHDPSKIPQMLKELDQGADLVLGSRYIEGGGIPLNWPLHRKFLSRIGNLFIRLVMLNFKISDWTTGYRAISREVVEKILPSLRHSAFNGYTWQIGFLVKSIQSGFRVSEVPFYFKDRDKGHSKLGPEYIFNTLRYIMKVRLEQILHSRVLKFLIVGGTGAVIQFTALHFYRKVMPFQLAFFLAIETSILSNFTWNNLWTFRDRKLKVWQIPLKFLQFNLASGGSILIQQTIAFIGERFIGLYTIYQFPGTPYTLDTGAMFAAVGIFVGMFWNFFAYSHIIWKKKQKLTSR